VSDLVGRSNVSFFNNIDCEDRPEKTSFRDKYEIDPSKNNGHSYAYHDVVRKKECRKHLQGEDCEECKNVSCSPPDHHDSVW
jgi:hypothetical protein